MTELSLSLPVVGEKDTTAEPKVTTALSEVQTVINGKIGAVNIEESGITGKKLGSETVRMTETTYGALTERAKETAFEASASRPALVLLQVASKNNNEIFAVSVAIVGNITLTGGISLPAIAAAKGGTVMSFILPPGKKWEWSSPSGEAVVKSSYLLL